MVNALAIPKRRSQLGRDFNLLWGSLAASQTGSAVALGAFTFVATEVLDSSSFEVSLLAAAGYIAAGVLGLPMGPWAELRRKRPILIAADLVRALALVSVPIAHLAESLTYSQLLIVAGLVGVGQMMSVTAGTAHLKALVEPGDRTTAASRIETTSWIASSTGPPVGGALLGAIGPTITLTVDAISHMLSAVSLSRIRKPEPPPATRAQDRQWRKDIGTGWSFLFAHPTLRPLFLNAMLFGAMVMGTQPLVQVFMLRDLGFTPLQYGMTLGLPALAGLIGAAIAPWLERRWGRDRVMVILGALRAVWLIPIAFAPPGLNGVIIIIVCDSLLLFFAGAFNPLFASHRMEAVPDHVMARMSAAWGVSNRVLWPIAMLLSGALAMAFSTQVSVLVGGILLALSGLFLPWRLLRTSTSPSNGGPP